MYFLVLIHVLLFSLLIFILFRIRLDMFVFLLQDALLLMGWSVAMVIVFIPCHGHGQNGG